MAKTRFTTPTMRMVQGDVDTPQDKDSKGQLRVIKTGPNAGQPNPQFFVAGAVVKSDPAWPGFWETLVRQAAADFPNLFPHGVDALIQAGGPQAWFKQPPQGHTHPWVMGDFSWKITDGDSSAIVDGQLVEYAKREGWAGCWVVKFGSSYPPRIFDAGRYAAHEQIQEKGFIKRGYYIRVSGSTEGNSNAQRPGLYLNLDMVERSAIFHEIVLGPDASAAFGAAPVALPPGVTPTMGAPAGNAPVPAAPAYAPPAAPAAPVPAAPVAGATPYPAAASPAPASPAPAPYAGFIPAAGSPPAPTAAAPSPPVIAAPPAPPSAPVATASLTEKAGGATYEQLIAAGWTDDTLRQHGLMV